MGVEALRSLTSNAAGPSQHLQLPFSVDLVFSNAPLRARRVAASRGRRTNSTTTSRVVSSYSSPFGNRGLDHSCICRANSFDQSQGGLPERENPPDGAIKNQAERGNGMESNTKVRLQFGSSSAHLDGFRRSSSLDFEDEFFTRMMALEASHRDTGRACSTTFFENGATLGATPSTEPNSHEPLCALGMGGVQLPSSIKKLRRQNRASEQHHPQGCAIKNAFSSMVYMIKAVQSHALQIRQVLFSEWDVQEVLHLVHREMHSSFVWLFQQVFACTPKLMVSVMLLLANFTVYSMGENVAIASTETPAPIAFFLSAYGNPQASLDPHFKTLAPRVSHSSPRPGPSSGGNNNKPPPPSIAESFEGDGRALNLFSHRDSIRDAPLLQEDDAKKKMQLEMMKAWVESSMMELKNGEVLHHQHQVQLEQETIRRLVAPVVAHLESDNYACFDRTDLEYQHALSKDPSNSLLHANYAQFLYVVRHDHDRAENYFHRAMQADPLDSAILGRFASFLWLGRGNRSAAERVYKAAMAADPDSSFPASNYAHFLWHVGDGGESSLGPMTV